MVRFVLFLVAVVGLVLSAVVHGAALLGAEGEGMLKLAQGLEVGVFGMVGVAILSVMKGMEPGVSAGTKKLLRAGAAAALIGVVVLLAYAAFNIVHVTSMSRGGDPMIAGKGLYALVENGHLVRGMTPDEYQHRSAYRDRVASANWMLFYCAAALLLALPACKADDGRNS